MPAWHHHGQLAICPAHSGKSYTPPSPVSQLTQEASSPFSFVYNSVELAPTQYTRTVAHCLWCWFSVSPRVHIHLLQICNNFIVYSNTCTNIVCVCVCLFIVATPSRVWARFSSSTTLPTRHVRRSRRCLGESLTGAPSLPLSSTWPSLTAGTLRKRWRGADWGPKCVGGLLRVHTEAPLHD